jgi:hypothetical protein
MTKKAEFNAEEWASVVEGPVLAGMRVVTSSRGGTIRESLAMGKVYTAAREAQGSSELLDELVTSPPAIEGGRIEKGADVKALVGERLTAAVASVEANATPEEAEAYKRFVVSVAEAAAKAHKEGGFIGIGGKEISPEEQAALDEIRATLGLTG